MGFQDQEIGHRGPAGTIDVIAELHQLEKMAERLRLLVEPPSDGSLSITPKKLSQIIKARRARERQLGSDLFADPAWDILLEAYLSELTQTRLSISSLCLGAAVPSTTALRWIAKLQQEGWLQRTDDPTDARRSWVELSRAGSDRLSRYFGSIPDALPI